MKDDGFVTLLRAHRSVAVTKVGDRDELIATVLDYVLAPNFDLHLTGSPGHRWTNHDTVMAAVAVKDDSYVQIAGVLTCRTVEPFTAVLAPREVIVTNAHRFMLRLWWPSMGERGGLVADDPIARLLRELGRCGPIAPDLAERVAASADAWLAADDGVAMRDLLHLTGAVTEAARATAALAGVSPIRARRDESGCFLEWMGGWGATRAVALPATARAVRATVPTTPSLEAALAARLAVADHAARSDRDHDIDGDGCDGHCALRAAGLARADVTWAKLTES